MKIQYSQTGNKKPENYIPSLYVTLEYITFFSVFSFPACNKKNTRLKMMKDEISDAKLGKSMKIRDVLEAGKCIFKRCEKAHNILSSTVKLVEDNQWNDKLLRGI